MICHISLVVFSSLMVKAIHYLWFGPMFGLDSGTTMALSLTLPAAYHCRKRRILLSSITPRMVGCLPAGFYHLYADLTCACPLR